MQQKSGHDLLKKWPASLKYVSIGKRTNLYDSASKRPHDATLLSSIDISKYICYTMPMRVSQFQHQSFTSCDLKLPSSVSRLQLPLNSIQAKTRNNIWTTSHMISLLWSFEGCVCVKCFDGSWGSTRRNELHDDLNLLFPGLHGKRMFWCNSWLDLVKREKTCKAELD